MTLTEFRQKHGNAYNDLSDEQLANKLYEKHYSDMPRQAFNRQMGYTPKTMTREEFNSNLVMGVARGAASVGHGVLTGLAGLAGLPGTLMNASQDAMRAITGKDIPTTHVPDSTDVSNFFGDLAQKYIPGYAGVYQPQNSAEKFLSAAAEGATSLVPGGAANAGRRLLVGGISGLAGEGAVEGANLVEKKSVLENNPLARFGGNAAALVPYILAGFSRPQMVKALSTGLQEGYGTGRAGAADYITPAIHDAQTVGQELKVQPPFPHLMPENQILPAVTREVGGMPNDAGILLRDNENALNRTQLDRQIYHEEGVSDPWTGPTDVSPGAMDMLLTRMNKARSMMPNAGTTLADVGGTPLRVSANLLSPMGTTIRTMFGVEPFERSVRDATMLKLAKALLNPEGASPSLHALAQYSMPEELGKRLITSIGSGAIQQDQGPPQLNLYGMIPQER